MHMLRYCLLALITVTCLFAVDDERTMIRWGTQLEGPSLTRADLEGRVLLLVMWDLEVDNVEWLCEIAPLRKRFGDKLIIVASHWNGPRKQEVLDAWTMVKGGEYITLMQGSQMAGDSRLTQAIQAHADGARGKPRRGGGTLRMASSYDKSCHLFDHEGRRVLHGNIDEAAKRLPALYKAAPGYLAFSEEPWQQVAKEAAILGDAAKTMTPTLSDLREILAGVDMVKIAEAQRLLDRVEAWKNRELEEINRLRTLDATTCMIRLDHMLSWLKKDELCEPFEALSKELKDDKVFQACLKAEDAMRSLRADAHKMRLAKDPVAAKEVSSNSSRLKKIYKSLNNIIESLPETNAATTAQAMLAAYDLR